MGRSDLSPYFPLSVPCFMCLSSISFSLLLTLAFLLSIHLPICPSWRPIGMRLFLRPLICLSFLTPFLSTAFYLPALWTLYSQGLAHYWLLFSLSSASGSLHIIVFPQDLTVRIITNSEPTLESIAH